MKALIRKRTTSTALNSPTSAPKPSTISKVSQVLSCSPTGEPRAAVSQAASMAANAMTLSIERSMCPATMQKERPTASSPTKVACCAMFKKMPSWKKCSIESEQTRRIAARMPQTRWSRTKVRTTGRRALAPPSVSATDAKWRLRLLHHVHRHVRELQIAPEPRLVDIGLGDRRPRDLEVRPPRLLGQHRVQPQHLVGAGLGLAALEDQRQEHGDAVDLGVGRLLDLDLLPALPDVVEADRGAVGRHHHHLAGFHALAFHDRDDRHRQVCRVAEDEVNVGIHQDLVLEHPAGVGGLPLERRLADDLDVGRLLGHHLLEALLDVEGVAVARIAQDLQHLALGRAVLFLQQ